MSPVCALVPQAAGEDTASSPTVDVIAETSLSASSELFLSSLNKFFPQSYPTSQMRHLVHEALVEGRHYTPCSTLFATSICPDEINGKPQLSLSSTLYEDLLGSHASAAGTFALGGLAGLPFAGISGLQALFSHVPKRLVILLGPHVGIAQNGRVGLVERGSSCGLRKADRTDAIESHLSTACGAAIGAGKKLFQLCHEHHDKLGHPCLPEKSAEPNRLGFLDFEEDYILDQLRPSIEALSQSEEEPSSSSTGDDGKCAAATARDDERNAHITTLMWAMSHNMFIQVLEACWQRGGCPEHVEEITLLSGIIVNQGEVVSQNAHPAEDYFQPRLFQTWTKPDEGWTAANSSSSSPALLVDLFPSTFGSEPKTVDN